jgi:hypothetical protein
MGGDNAGKQVIALALMVVIMMVNMMVMKVMVSQSTE